MMEQADTTNLGELSRGPCKRLIGNHSGDIGRLERARGIGLLDSVISNGAAVKLALDNKCFARTVSYDVGTLVAGDSG